MSSVKFRINNIINQLNRFYGRQIDPSGSAILDVLIATKLSQNTTDRTAFIAYRNLKNRFKTWDNVRKARLELIKKEIKVCGLADTKSRDIKNILNDIYNKRKSVSLEYLHKLKDNDVYDVLLNFKGIGVKTASCVLMFGMNRIAFPVDTHIHRILNRIGIVNTKSAEETFEVSKTLIPKAHMKNLHINLIKFGRNFCKAKNPVCGNCILYEECEFKEKEMYLKNNSISRKENNFIILDNL